MGGDHLLHEAAVDRVSALGGGGDQRVQGELVDVARLALAGVEDLAGRVVGQDRGIDLGALEVEAQVVGVPGGILKFVALRRNYWGFGHSSRGATPKKRREKANDSTLPLQISGLMREPQVRQG